jgi:hypothetical protein
LGQIRTFDGSLDQLVCNDEPALGGWLDIAWPHSHGPSVTRTHCGLLCHHVITELKRKNRHV